MRKPLFVLAGITLVLALAAPESSAAPPGKKDSGKHAVLDPDGVQRLKDNIGRDARVRTSDATGGARFVGREPGAAGDLMSWNSQPARQKSYAFLREYAGVFGLRDPGAELRLAVEQTDRIGGKHVTYVQVYRDVPVFAGVIKAHFNDAGELTSVDGNIIPEIGVDPNPSRSLSEAANVALAKVGGENGKSLAVQSTQLLVYRTGLARGEDGDNHLAWQVEVGNGADVREFVYVDAHSGKVIDQLTGIFDGLNRRAYDGQFSTAVPPPNYPATPFWVEGQLPFPTGNTEADNMIISSKETYDFYNNAFGRDSFDALGATMDAIFNRGNACPNASWNGTFISFCNGLTTDDVTGHEWTHAYTQYTHGLIYAWQPGALNEAYSDIYGETIDQINGRMTDSPNTPRTAGQCSVFEIFPPITRVTAPAGIAADYASGTSAFSPVIVEPGTPGEVIRPDDGAVGTGNTATDGCALITVSNPLGLATPNSWANAAQVAGKIVLVDRGLCGFHVKAYNAQINGAIGVIIANVAGSGAPTVPPNMAAAAGVPAVTIPTTSMNFANGELLRAQLAVPNTVNATLKPATPATADSSVRWMVGEDDTATGLFGPLRDMWTPTCFGNPGKVSDAAYGCSTADQGGVHDNSGVPNHAYALLVDGGTYNGQTISPIGLTKAAHIYFRAMTFHQNPTTNFPAHADAIEQSATDLMGVNLADLSTGAPSGQIINAADLAEIQKAMLAVQMRTPPTQCNFQPLLGQTPPPDPACGPDTVKYTLFSDNFEGNTSGWSVSHEASGTGFTERDWSVSSTLPDGRAGKAFFAPDPTSGTCAPGGDETGVLHLTSPAILMPATLSSPTLTFQHWVATETGFDGGQLMISVNGGPYTLVPQANFIYNAHNLVLATVTQGNSNPRANQRAWSGTDGGMVDGTWGRTIVNLTGLAAAGQTIRLRWDLSTDGCGGSTFGWYVDDVTVYVCIPELPTATAYLRGTGPAANPPTLFLGSIPTTTSAKYRDSASVNFNGGNLFKEIGTWTSTPPLGGLTTLGPLNTWIGLKNSDDIGTRFDLRVELYKNGDLVAQGLTRCIEGVTRNEAQAKAVAVAFGALQGTAFSGSDVLSVKILTRIGTKPNDTLCGGHSNAVGLRLYFDSTNRASSFVENP